MYVITQNDYASALYSYYAKSYKPNPQGPGNFMSLVVATVAEMVQKHPATGIPTGDDLPINSVTSPADTNADGLQAFLAKCGTPSTNVIVVGETHENSSDVGRANSVIEAMVANAPKLIVNMVFFERGLSYKTPSVDGIFIAREENITQPRISPNFWQGLSAAQRSMAVAGYLAACAGAGPQNTKTTFLLFFGANHSDILQAFEQAVRQSGLHYLLKQERNYDFVKSNA